MDVRREAGRVAHLRHLVSIEWFIKSYESEQKWMHQGTEYCEALRVFFYEDPALYADWRSRGLKFNLVSIFKKAGGLSLVAPLRTTAQFDIAALRASLT